MKLPQTINYSVHEILIPSLGRKYRFRPFLVKEHKALLIANGSNDLTEMLNTLKQIIKDCCLEENIDFDVDKLATFDFEYLLINLRAISVGNVVSLSVRCQHEEKHEGMDESSLMSDVILDLSKVEIVGLKDYTNKIELGNNCVVIMKLPTVNLMEKINKEAEEVKKDEYTENIERIANNIDKIVNDGEVFEVADNPDFSLTDMSDWISNLTSQQFEKLNDYFISIPYCRVRIDWTCPVCGNSNTLYIQGLDYFF